jgi:two-component system, cell cycle sensor histidine kinase and response regulator CckA
LAPTLHAKGYQTPEPQGDSANPSAGFSKPPDGIQSMSGRNGDPSVRAPQPGTQGVDDRHLVVEADGSFSGLFDRFPDALVLLDEKGCLVEANQAACELVGFARQDLLGRNVAELIQTRGREFEDAWEQFQRTNLYRGQAWLVRADGTSRLIEITASPNFGARRHLVAGRDLTNRYFLEDQLVLRERNEALAKLAGGIAHDLTNLFNVIGGYVELIVRQIPPAPALQPHIDGLVAAAQQGAALTAQLSALGHQQILSPAVLDLTAIVHSCSRALRSVVPSNIEITLPPAGDRSPIRVDRSQMAQVIFSVASTASELLPQGGLLRIEVYRQTLEKPLARPGSSIPAGNYVVLRFHAQPGKREPAAQGSLSGPNRRKDVFGGLVPQVAHVLKQNDGHLWLDDAGLADTIAVMLYFPSMAGHPIGLPEPEPGADLGGHETILIAETDPTLRETMGEYLKALGYNVLRASSGEEALDKIRSVPNVELVITDWNLPRTGGEELAREISAACPDAKILFVSGDMDPALLRRSPGTKKPAILCKPFQLRVLANTLRDLLDRKTYRTASSMG